MSSFMLQARLLALLNSDAKDICFVDTPGAGKSIAIIVASLNSIVDQEGTPEIIIFCATYEAALQMWGNVKMFAEECQLNIEVQLITKECEASAYGKIIIGTPGELLKYVTNFELKSIFMDDGDTYFTMEKVQEMIRGLEETKMAFISSTCNRKAQLQTNLLGFRTAQNADIVQPRNITHCAITDIESIEDRTVVIIDIIKRVITGCPWGKVVVFCQVYT